MFSDDRYRVAVAADGAGLCILERSPAWHNLHLRTLEQRANAAIELVDDCLLPRNGLWQIENRRLAKADTKRAVAGRMLHRLELAGNMDECLRRDAAADEAGPAQPLIFDDRRVEAELPRADRRDIAARPAADDKNFCPDFISHDSVHEKHRRCFELSADLLHELGGVPAVHDTMVEGRRQVHHLADHDLAVLHHRTF